MVDLPPIVYKQLLVLNMHKKGMMQKRFMDYYKVKDPDARAVVLMDAEAHVLAWVFVFEVKYACPLMGEWREPIGSMQSYFYVRRDLQRRGYGTRLHSYVHSRWPRAQVQPWNPKSRAFFAEMGRTHDYRPPGVNKKKLHYGDEMR